MALGRIRCCCPLSRPAIMLSDLSIGIPGFPDVSDTTVQPWFDGQAPDDSQADGSQCSDARGLDGCTE